MLGGEAIEETVRQLAYGGGEYRQALELRNALLRKPLGLDLGLAGITGEESNRHYGLFRCGELVACVMAVPLGDDQLQIRQMAVREAFQGRGLGRRLLLAVEAALREVGCRFLVLNARESAIGFYRNLGYQPVGEFFLELGIVHQRMEKALAIGSGPTGPGK